MHRRRKDYLLTREAGFFGSAMSEYVLMQVCCMQCGIQLCLVLLPQGHRVGETAAAATRTSNRCPLAATDSLPAAELTADRFYVE